MSGVLREALDHLRSAQYAWEAGAILGALEALCEPDVVVHLSHPFGDLVGVEAFASGPLAALRAAWPDVERRDFLVMSGCDDFGAAWVGCAGHFAGTFAAPFLDIPPTGHLTHMRFHEFYRFEAGRVVEVQALWDIPEVMMQAGAWPMAPSLGRECWVPGPASGDGLCRVARDEARSRASQDRVIAMLGDLVKHPAQGGPEVMDLPRHWHRDMMWYGPAGIGSMRGIAGFRNWHQIPFLAAMPDRGQADDQVTFHFFGDNDYVGVTGWPDMIQTMTGDGWLGIAPAGQRVEMRSLDFWRLEAGLIRENWVMLDMLDIYRQLGVDVLARMRAFNKARVPGSVPFPVGVSCVL